MANYREQTTTTGALTACPSCAPPDQYTGGASQSTSNAACASTDITYSFYFQDNDIVKGVTVYTDVGLSTIFVGNSGWYRVGTPQVTKSVQINSFGEIIEFVVLCP